MLRIIKKDDYFYQDLKYNHFRLLAYNNPDGSPPGLFMPFALYKPNTFLGHSRHIFA